MPWVQWVNRNSIDAKHCATSLRYMCLLPRNSFFTDPYSIYSLNPDPGFLVNPNPDP